MKIKRFVISFVLIILAGCATIEKQTITPLEIQWLQSREYNETKEIVFRSIVSVLQDLGYAIKNADIQTGLISAESAAISDPISRLFGSSKITQTMVTAFVEKIGTKTKARLSFVESVNMSSTYGQTDRRDTPILDARLYENAFGKIDNAIFIRSVDLR